jgi:transcription elongation factor/antiterminator RfaH
MRRWHIIQSKPHQEERVEAQIRELTEIEVYAPRIEVRAVRGAAKVTVVKPLFPSYLFARLDLPEEWKLITFTRGVTRILGGWEQPRPVDDAVVAAIRERENKKDRLIHYYRFRPREAVVVRAGPLKDLYGIFERYVDEGARVRILLSLVGYQAAVELEAELVAKV